MVFITPICQERVTMKKDDLLGSVGQPLIQRYGNQYMKNHGKVSGLFCVYLKLASP